MQPARRPGSWTTLRPCGATEACGPRCISPIPLLRSWRDTLGAIFGAKDLGAVHAIYHPACAIHLPQAQTAFGHERFAEALFGILAAFPDAAIAIEHSIACDTPGQPVRVATRWWLTGTHTGQGRYGPPSGATVLALVITHSQVVDGLIREEWHVTDEVAILKQIALHRLLHAAP